MSRGKTQQTQDVPLNRAHSLSAFAGGDALWPRTLVPLAHVGPEALQVSDGLDAVVRRPAGGHLAVPPSRGVGRGAGGGGEGPRRVVGEGRGRGAAHGGRDGGDGEVHRGAGGRRVGGTRPRGGHRRPLPLRVRRKRGRRRRQRAKVGVVFEGEGERGRARDSRAVMRGVWLQR